MYVKTLKTSILFLHEQWLEFSMLSALGVYECHQSAADIRAWQGSGWQGPSGCAEPSHSTAPLTFPVWSSLGFPQRLSELPAEHARCVLTAYTGTDKGVRYPGETEFSDKEKYCKLQGIFKVTTCLQTWKAGNCKESHFD